MPFDAAPQELADWQKNALELADFVEKSTSFNMIRVTNECGTPACVMGHAQALFGCAWHTLCLGMGNGLLMFYPNQDDGLNYYDDNITPKMAAAMLRRYAATGEVRYEWGDA